MEEKKFDTIAFLLTKLGLKTEEARAYVALLRLKEANASEIARVGNIPRSHIYEVLNSLLMRGLIRLTSDNPRRFAPTNPDLALKSLIDRIKREMDFIYDKINSLVKSFKEPEKSMTILMGKNLLKSLMYDMSKAHEIRIADNIGIVRLIDLDVLKAKATRIKLVLSLNHSLNLYTNEMPNDKVDVRFSYLILPLSLVIIDNRITYLVHSYDKFLLGIRITGDISQYVKYFDHVWSDHYAKVLRRARAMRITEIY